MNTTDPDETLPRWLQTQVGEPDTTTIHERGYPMSSYTTDDLHKTLDHLDGILYGEPPWRHAVDVVGDEVDDLSKSVATQDRALARVQADNRGLRAENARLA